MKLGNKHRDRDVLRAVLEINDVRELIVTMKSGIISHNPIVPRYSGFIMDRLIDEAITIMISM